MPCEVSGCERRMHGRRWCHTHYEKMRRTGTITYLARPTECAVPGCVRRVQARGMCHTHYAKVHRTGTLERLRRPGQRGGRSKNDLHMWTRYGMDEAEYDELYTLQDGLCDICQEPRPNRGFNRLVIDHSHETGMVRGLLCRGCNTALAHAERASLFLGRALDYLLDAEDDQREATA